MPKQAAKYLKINLNIMNLKSLSNKGFTESNSKTNEYGIAQTTKLDKSSLTKWISSEEVCQLLMISKRTLQSYRDRGILPFAQAGRKIYYKSSDIDEYLDRHYIKASYQKGGAA